MNNYQRAYKLWKNLSVKQEKFGGRKVNFPASVSKQVIKELGISKKGNKVVSCSNFDWDVSNFGRKCDFDNLYFCRLNFEENQIYIYDLKLSGSDVEKIKVNKNESVLDQQKVKRLPRFSIIKKIIEPNNIQPSIIFDLSEWKVL